MRYPPVVLALVSLLGGGVPGAGRQLAAIAPNDNRVAAGTLRDGVLTIALEARHAMWYPDGDSLPGMPIDVFAEAGQGPTSPGPLIRVPAGTEIRASVRNALERDTLTFYVPARLADAARLAALDSIVLLPGETRELRTRAAHPGNFLYHASSTMPKDRALGMRGLLSGAIVVDTAGLASPPRDRVFVIQDAVDSLTPAGVPDTRYEVTSLNGRSWPHTERLDAMVGDTLRWRIINASPGVHPMHLHGFYFRVDDFDGPREEARKEASHMAVTERMTSFTTMSVSWVPERAGNWLFHCHYQPHASPHRALGPIVPSSPPSGHDDHMKRGMGGLVMGVHVRAPNAVVARPSAPRRRLRLVALRDPGFPDSLPSMRFVIEEDGRRTAARTGFSPTIELRKNEPVAINVVNTLGEPLAVHWHGIELESYFDGVAGFAGAGNRLAPIIAASDSFEAHMTPPRSGTFMYHSHVDEARHHRAGLAGALIVRDRPPDNEHLFFIKSARSSRQPFPMEVNGEINPDTIVLRVGRTYRFRFVGLAVTSPNATAYLTARPDSSLQNLRDTMLVRWRSVAKDGADLPERDRVLRPAIQVVSIGETHDVEFVPRSRGNLRLEIRPPSAGRLFARVPIRVE